MEERLLQYDSNPTTCSNCQKELPYKKRKNKFCSKSCSASYNNKTRSTHTLETRLAISNSIKEYIKNNPRLKNKKTLPIKNCIICSKNYTGFRKTCSHQCFITLRSKQQSHRLKTDVQYRQKLGTRNRSFMETSFEIWVRTNYPKLEFIAQKPIQKNDQKGYYYIDFFFPNKNLAIELDGSQHNLPQSKLHDQIRDLYLQSLNITVVRITAKEYKSKSRLDEIKQLLI